MRCSVRVECRVSCVSLPSGVDLELTFATQRMSDGQPDTDGDAGEGDTKPVRVRSRHGVGLPIRGTDLPSQGPDGRCQVSLRAEGSLQSRTKGGTEIR